MLPEVILFTHSENAVSGNTDILLPYLKSLIIILIYRYKKPVGRNRHILREKFPRPWNRFLFKIIPKRKITQHFKKCTMPGCLADILNIRRSDAFLTGCHSVVRRCFSTCKIGLERRHACIDQQYTRVIMRYQRKAW